MIQPQTYLTVADNTGAKNLMCIRILGNNRKYANVGDIIIGVVKDAILATFVTTICVDWYPGP